MGVWGPEREVAPWGNMGLLTALDCKPAPPAPPAALVPFLVCILSSLKQCGLLAGLWPGDLVRGNTLGCRGGQEPGVPGARTAASTPLLADPTVELWWRLPPAFPAPFPGFAQR